VPCAAVPPAEAHLFHRNNCIVHVPTLLLATWVKLPARKRHTHNLSFSGAELIRGSGERQGLGLGLGLGEACGKSKIAR